MDVQRRGACSVPFWAMHRRKAPPLEKTELAAFAPPPIEKPRAIVATISDGDGRRAIDASSPLTLAPAPTAAGTIASVRCE
jgi:hypothetical protein